MFASHCDARGMRGGFATSLMTAALILIGTALAPTSHAAGSYPGALIATQSHPSAMAPGDYNADGVTDFAVLNYSTSTVSILIAGASAGVGDGTFQEIFSFTVGEEPWDIASGDLDGDGYLDLAVTEGLANQLSIWRPNKPGGVPDGTFFAGQVKGTGQYPVSVVMFDYSGDGLTDIAVANYWSDNVSLYRGDGTGNASSDGTLEAGTRPIDLGTGDFDGDLLSDLVIVNLLSDDVTAYVGQAGSDALLAAGSYAAGPRPVSVEIAPLVEGTDDLLLANYYDDEISFLYSTSAAQGQGELFEAPQYPLPLDVLQGGAPRGIDVVDLNGDGVSDLVVALEDRDEVITLRGFPGGAFSQQNFFHAGFRPLQVTTAQVDDDGYLDIVCVSHWTHGIYVLNGMPDLAGNATTMMEPFKIDSGIGEPTRTLLLDLNGDSNLEIISMGQRFGDLSVRLGIAAPEYFSITTEREDLASRPTGISYGQLSSDDLPDIVSTDAVNNIVLVNQADPLFASLLRPWLGVSVSPNPQDLVTGDFDRDGDDDIISFSIDQGRLNLILVDRQESITGRSFTGNISIAVAPSDANDNADLRLSGGGADSETGSALAIGGDFNNDGRSDFAIGSPGEGVVRIYYGAESLSETPSLVLTGSAADRFGSSLAFGDIDNDGTDDLLVGAPSSNAGAPGAGQVILYRGGQDTASDLSVNGTQDGEALGSSLVSGADLNGDGADDWAASSPLYDGAGADAGRVYLFWGNGLDGNSDLIIEGQVGGDIFGTSLGISRDFTADDQPDLLVGAPGVSTGSFQSNGRIQVYAGGSSIGTIPFMAADGPVGTAALGASIAGIGDYNGDGVGDIAAGAPLFDDDSGDDRGLVSVWFGGAAADNVPDYERAGSRSGARLGSAVAAAGDVRQSGTEDFIVSSPNYFLASGSDPSTHVHGRAFIIKGGSVFGDPPSVTLSGRVPGGLYGSALAGGADLNGDGFADWVVGANLDDTDGDKAGVAFSYNGGRGGIPGPGAIARGDFNGDGEADLVAVNTFSGEVAIFLNDPNETFVDVDNPAIEIFVLDGQPSAVTTADLDNDTFDDLVIVREGFEDLVIYRSDGDGTFTLDQNWPIGPQVVGFDLAPRRVYVEDLTGNGERDLVTVLSAWGAVSVREGAGGFSFGDLSLYAGTSVTSDVALADITKDSNVDMIMADELNSAISMHYHRDSGSGKLQVTDVSPTPARVAPLLAQNHPNPFNPKTLIRFDLPVGGKVSLEVFDVRGRKVATLVNEKMESGPQQSEWAGRDDQGSEVAAGVYLYRLTVDGEDMGRRKMVLAK